jgi:hypothetical protein
VKYLDPFFRGVCVFVNMAETHVCVPEESESETGSSAHHAFKRVINGQSL